MLAPGSDNSHDRSQSNPGPLRTVATQGSAPGTPTEAGRVKNARVNESSYGGVTRRSPRNAEPGSGAAAADENVRLSQPHNREFDRFEAISALADSDEAMAELTLIELLYDKDPAIRESAVESLASLGAHGAIQGLGFALTDSDPLVRQSALEFLAEIGTPDALQALSATLNDPDVDLRLAAVYELAYVENATALSLLQQFLADTDLSVRQLAAEFLNDSSQGE